MFHFSEGDFSPKREDQSGLIEWTALDMLRCIFVGYAERNSQGVGAAMSRGDFSFQRGFSMRLTAALLGFADALRTTRQSPIQFSDPRCPTCRRAITDCEMRALRVIRAKGEGRESDAAVEAMMLCDGVCDERLLDAAQEVASLLREARLVQL